MSDFVSEILPLIQAHSLSGLPLDADMQSPFYEGYSLANIPASLCSWLGMSDLPGSELNASYSRTFSDHYDQVIHLVIDGLGLKLFQKSSAASEVESDEWRDTVGSGALFPLTSVSPSTTSAALTTFWTGATPSRHGITGYEMWLREYNLSANMITHSPAAFDGPPGGLRAAGFDPLKFLSVPTLGPSFGSAGVDAFVLQHKSIAYSGLSTMLFPQTRTVPFRGLNDMFLTIEELAQAEGHGRRYIYAYWGDLDELQHVYGPENTRIHQEMRSVQRGLSRLIRHLRMGLPRKTMLLVTADHGQKGCEISDRYLVRNAPEFVNCLHMLPAGESRMAYLYVRPGYEESLRQVIEDRWPGEFIVVRSEDAMQAGLFGPEPFHSELRSRVGDLILIGRKGAYLYWPLKENALRGRHGGLSNSEMLIPLFVSDLAQS